VVEILTRYAKLLAVFALFWIGLWAWNARGCRRIEGPEMEPTLPRDKVKLINPNVFLPAELDAGDLVSFTVVQGSRGARPVAARVIGLPGDKVRIEKGEVFVNGAKADSGYVAQNNRSQDDYAEIIVPRDSVFLLCDNRRASGSLDSRALGPISAWAIHGKF
jgi:signal peptidase I